MTRKERKAFLLPLFRNVVYNCGWRSDYTVLELDNALAFKDASLKLLAAKCLISQDLFRNNTIHIHKIPEYA
jgi:hypothetical protein